MAGDRVLPIEHQALYGKNTSSLGSEQTSLLDEAAKNQKHN